MAARAPTALVSLAIVALAAMPVAAQQAVEPVARDLAFPANMAFAPDGRIFFTEKETGNVRIIRDGQVLPKTFAHVSAEGSAERGLSGIALDPSFERQPWVYLYYSETGGVSNRTTGSPVPVGTPTSPGSGRNATTGVGLVIAAVLVGGLILLRRRIVRR
jgi:glucose/arabinose dehydrogenase